LSAYPKRVGAFSFGGTLTLYSDPNGLSLTDATGVLRSGSEGTSYPGTATDIYFSGEWSVRREAEYEYYRWYSGQKLAETSDAVDPTTNEQVPMWPLGLNPIAKYCRIHRAVTIGAIDDYTDLPTKIVFVGLNETMAQQSTDLVTSVLLDNNAPVIFNEAALMTQIFGGHVFKAAFDPFNDMLAYRIRIESIRSPYFYPVPEPTDYWNLREAYIGYQITAQVAMDKYGIEQPKSMWVLYMEHWTRNSFEITVDGQAPKVPGNFKGEHAYGRVPMVYIPHYRQGGFFGPSHVPDLIGLTREENARLADAGDSVYTETHPTPILRNVTRDVSMRPFLSDGDGNVISQAVDLGSAPNVANSHDPDAFYLDAPPQTIQSVAQLQSLLMQSALQQADVAPVLVGTDDTASGRITGPVSNMRAAASVQHAQSERLEFSTGLRHLANIIQRIAFAHQNQYKALGIEMPITKSHWTQQCKTIWPAMLPIEAAEKVTVLNSRLLAGGISLESYLEELHVQDVSGEADRIWADLQRKAEIAGSVALQTAEIQAQVQTQQIETQAQTAEAQAKAAARQRPPAQPKPSGAATGK